MPREAAEVNKQPPPCGDGERNEERLRKDTVMRSNGLRNGLAFVMLVVPACVVLAGCSSGPEKTAGEERSAMAVGGLKETRAELVAAKAQINKTLSVMNAMRDGQGALPTEFAAYN